MTVAGVNLAASLDLGDGDDFQAMVAGAQAFHAHVKRVSGAHPWLTVDEVKDIVWSHVVPKETPEKAQRASRVVGEEPMTRAEWERQQRKRYARRTA